jgi:PEP-CTERM motif
MSFRRILTLGFSFVLAVVVAGSSRPAQAGSESYEILINSSAAGLVAGPGGLVDIELNPNGPQSPATVSALLFGLNTDGTVGSTTGGTPIGDVTGTLPGMVSMDNGQLTQDLTQNFSVGSFFDIFVTISGSDIGNPNAMSGTVFSLTIGDSASNFAGGSLSVNPDGTLSPSVVPGVMIIPYTGSVPEPSSMVLLGAGLAAVVAASRWRKRRKVA